ncbi:MAG: nucleotidyltransferase domain-containing protein [Flavobacteriales bacterium]|nr:nucleotidyltransferase domain-containing protein [Flavobacteriales bacterium]
MERSTTATASYPHGEQDDLRSLQRTVLNVLAYFDVFSHPMKVEEIARFAVGTHASTERILQALTGLEKNGHVHRSGPYWGLLQVEKNAHERLAAESRARTRMPKAEVMARRIAKFPFVRAVFISGSMSKGCIATDGDIDFFVVTAPGRLWVARTLLVLYKKIFLLNSRRDFCVNYFLDTEHLAVEDRNLFTATEVVTLMPMYGNGTTEAFFSRNAWAFKMLPGAPTPKSRELAIGSARSKGLGERLLHGSLGDTLDNWCMQLTWHYWKRKFSELDPQAFELALRTRTYVSKHHPRNFQARVLDGLGQRLRTLEKRTGVPLS